MDKIVVITPEAGKTAWEEALAQVAAEARGRLWDLPRWVVSDSRHRRAAEVALMHKLEKTALPTHGLCTPASLAGEVLRYHPQSLVVTAAAASLALAEILAENCPEAYRASADKPGFAQAFWNSLCEAESRGFFPGYTLPEAEGPRPPEAFASLQERLHERLSQLERCTPGQFLLRAVCQLDEASCQFETSSLLFIGPMLRCQPLEREFLGRLAARAQQVVLFPAQGVPAEALLPKKYFSESKPAVDPSPSTPPHLCFIRPTTPEAELEAVFAALARWVAEGRFHYRDVRLVHPQAGEALPQILAAAARYQVPVKAGVGRELKDFPGVVSLQRLLAFFESGWPRERLLDLLRSRLLEASEDDGLAFIGEKSRLIEAILEQPDPRSRPPWRGWIEIARNQKAQHVAERLECLKDLDSAGARQLTGSAFASWVRKVARIILSSHPGRDDGFFTTLDLAEEEKAWKVLDAVLDDLEHSFAEAAPRGRLIAQLEQAIGLSRYVPDDLRRDAVEVVPGSRDDFLPVPAVLYMGLTSAVPSPDRHNPFFAAQTPLSYDEKLRLFRQIASNAQDTLLLSCPRFDNDGNELAPSPFLKTFPPGLDSDRVKAESAALLIQAESWQPHEVQTDRLSLRTADPAGQGKDRVRRKETLAILADQSSRWSPSKLGRAIQCRYLLFAADVLKIDPRTDTLAEAVTPLLLGNIAHSVLQEYIAAAHSGNTYDVAAETRRKFLHGIAPFDPHPELDRAGAELERCLAEAAPVIQRLAEGYLPGEDRLEIVFKNGAGRYPALGFDWGSLRVSLEGKIDRLDLSGDHDALVVEYKYRKTDSESRNDFFEEVLSGNQPQLPLYWMVAREIMGLRPVALLQVYLRSGVTRVLKLAQAPIFPGEGEKNSEVRIVTEAEVEQMLANAREKLKESALGLARGILTALPQDFTRCGPASCAWADLCRFREAR